MDLATNSSANPAIKNMNTSYNTLHKTNGDWGYANIFTFGIVLKQVFGNQIDVSSFLPGIYVVDVENQKLRFIKK